jgi:dihydrofolate reductase
MRLSVIVAVAENGVIGKDNALPWRLPEDLKHFKAITFGHPVVMGRKTFESIGRPLPGRLNLVVSRNPDYRPEGVTVAASLESAIQKAGAAQEVFVIGGSALFKEALPKADRVYLTRIHRDFSGDVFFPEAELAGRFQTVKESRHESAGEPKLSFSFIEAERRH